MIRKLTIFFVFTFFAISFGLSFAAEDAASKATATETAVNKEQTSENGARDVLIAPEKIEIITNNLDAEEEILDFIPELKRHKDEKGSEYYTYNVSGRETKLEDLDEELIGKLFNRVINEGVRIRTERINKQIQINARAQEQVARQIQTLTQIQQRAAVIPQPPPAQPQQPPKPPPTPPAPPRR